MKIFTVLFITFFFFFDSFCLPSEEEIKNKTRVIKEYLGTFSDSIGTDLWIWVGIVSGGTFFICILMYSIYTFCECVLRTCCCGKKKEEYEMNSSSK